MPKRKPGTASPDEIVAALTKPHPRVECYGRLIAAAQDHLSAFLKAHPEWTGDVRSQAAAEFFTLFIGHVLDDILDDYVIAYPVDE